jgi:16S rRNA processing protein RimM
VYAARRRQLNEGEFWPQDLIGLEVRPGGGEVVAVTHGAAQDRLIIQRDELRFEVPFVEELVPIVDLGEGFVEVVEVEGLSEL